MECPSARTMVSRIYEEDTTNDQHIDLAMIPCETKIAEANAQTSGDITVGAERKSKSIEIPIDMGTDITVSVKAEGMTDLPSGIKAEKFVNGFYISGGDKGTCEVLCG